jgi:hypothetical protein
MGVSVSAGGLAIATWSRAKLWSSSCTFDKACELWHSRCFAALLLLVIPGTGGVAQPSWSGLPEELRNSGRPGHRAFFLASRIEEAPHAPRVGAGAAPPPNPPPRPTSGSHRLLHTLGQAGGQYGMGHRSPHLGVLGSHFHHFRGQIPQAGQSAGRTRANFRVSDLAVAS